jgi:hypothetical protein
MYKPNKKNIMENKFEFIELKNDSYYYCDKKYIRRRFISSCKRVLITLDQLNFVIIFKANEEGVAVEYNNNVYHNNNRHAYPNSSILKALEIVNTRMSEFTHEIKIHKSYYNDKIESIVDWENQLGYDRFYI